jgi:predicted amidohydrolase YtcJ
MCHYRSYSFARHELSRLHYKSLEISQKNCHSEQPEKDSFSQILPDNDMNKIWPPADIAIRNINIPGIPESDCVLIKENKILFVGKWAEAGKYTNSLTQKVNADNGFLLPGFCDSHVHLPIGAEHYQGCDVEGIDNFKDFSRKVKSFALNNPDLKAIHVYGLHYFDQPVIPPGKTRQMLDRIVDDRPLFVYAHDLHTGWANTMALEAADLFHKMSEWPEIVQQLNIENNIELDDDGVPTGELREPEAYFLVEANLRAKFPLSIEQKLLYLKETFNYLAGLGLTSVHSMGLALPEEDIELLLLLLELEERGELPLRVSVSFSVVPDENMFTDIDMAAEIRNAFREAAKGQISIGNLHDILVKLLEQSVKLRHEACLATSSRYPEAKQVPLHHYRNSEYINKLIHNIHVKPHLERLNSRLKAAQNKKLSESSKIGFHAVKIFMDGVIEKNTAYRKDRKPIEGIPAFSKDELEAVVLRADKLGLQVCAHCIGDASVSNVLAAVGRARQMHRREDSRRGHTIRHRIEHIELCTQEDIPLFKQNGVIASMQPLHERPPVTLWHQLVPESEWKTAFAWKELLNTGANLVFGSDWPIVSCNCWEGLERAVTRTPWKAGMSNQGVDFFEGLKAFSAGNAYAEYQENIRGEIKAGMLADVAIFKGELSLESPSPDKMQCAYTICDGKITYSNENS